MSDKIAEQGHKPLFPESRGNAKFQNDWKKQRDQLNIPLGASGKKFIPYHKAFFMKNYPSSHMRCEYDSALEPTFEGLVIEDGEKIDVIISHAKGGRALVIGASGFSFLDSLTNDVRDVDVVDLNPNQIAFNYALTAFISLTPKENLTNSLEAFRDTRYRFDDYLSIQLSEVRERYLEKLPQTLDQLQVPQEMRKAVVQIFNYHAFDFGLNMGIVVQNREIPSIWERFYAKYDEIQRRVREGKGFRFAVGNLLDWISNHQDSYDAIYTSNIFQYRKDETNLKDFLQILIKGLHSGGITNVYNPRGLPILSSQMIRDGGFKVLAYENYRSDDDPNWLVVQKS